MTELELYKFVHDKEIHWRGGGLILWLSNYEIADFAELLGDSYLSDGGVEVTLLSYGMIGLDIVDICNDFDIEPTKILRKDDIDP